MIHSFEPGDLITPVEGFSACEHYNSRVVMLVERYMSESIGTWWWLAWDIRRSDWDELRDADLGLGRERL